MSNILHICNEFDPAGDVVRSVGELNRFSKHKHEVYLKERHPYQTDMGFQEPELMAWSCDMQNVKELAKEWADGIIYHMVGKEKGCYAPNKPSAFRNSNLYFNGTSFYSLEGYGYLDSVPYKLLASSHKAARTFMPDCRFLPALIPMDRPMYSPNREPKSPCLAYIKQQELMSHIDLNTIETMALRGRTHSNLLFDQRKYATLVLDNITDGHYGLAGCEAMAQGIRAVVFNHPITQEQLKELSVDKYPPFIECPQTMRGVYEAIKTAPHDFCEEAVEWMNLSYNSPRLIERYWDTFCSELTNA